MVAVPVARVVQVPVDQVVHVVAVRDGLVAAAFAVDMVCVVAATGVVRRAARGVLFAHLELVFVAVVSVGKMQVAAVEVVHVIAVLYGPMSAAGTVDVVGMFVGAMVMSHGRVPWV
jgi:hypothetical protein